MRKIYFRTLGCFFLFPILLCADSENSNSKSTFREVFFKEPLVKYVYEIPVAQIEQPSEVELKLTPNLNINNLAVKASGFFVGRFDDSEDWFLKSISTSREKTQDDITIDLIVFTYRQKSEGNLSLDEIVGLEQNRPGFEFRKVYMLSNGFIIEPQVIELSEEQYSEHLSDLPTLDLGNIDLK